jgi:hypothetical protein
MEGSFRLRRILNGVAHVADVDLWAEAARRAEVVISDDVFSWRCKDYGPDAAGLRDPEWESPVIEGIREELHQTLPASGSYRVTVTRIFGTIVDSTQDDLRYAAAMALRNALGTGE